MAVETWLKDPLVISHIQDHKEASSLEAQYFDLFKTQFGNDTLPGFSSRTAPSSGLSVHSESHTISRFVFK